MKVGAVCGGKGSISNPMHLTLSWVCYQVERGLKMGVLEMERVTLKQETVVAFVWDCSLYNQVCLDLNIFKLLPTWFLVSLQIRGEIRQQERRLPQLRRTCRINCKRTTGHQREEEEAESVFLQKMQPTQGFLEALALCTYDP